MSHENKFTISLILRKQVNAHRKWDKKPKIDGKELKKPKEMALG